MDFIHLQPGGVIIDHKTGEVGLLMRRYDIVEHIPLTMDAYAVTGYFAVGGDADEHSNRILGWLDQGEDYATERLLEELRNDSVASLNNRYFPYTETGLLNMIRIGTFEYVACIKK